MAADRPASRAWSIWGAAIVVYAAAVFHRGSLGVAGPQALERFGVGPAALSALTVLQVGIYAGMQVPTGILVDRYGPRRVMTAAAVLLGAGQLLFSVAPVYPVALLARAILGLGDAMTWVSILRLVAAHFPARHYALVATISSAIGALGGIAATFPLAVALRDLGWTSSFAVVAALTLGYAMVCARFVQDAPPGQRAAQRTADASEILRRVRAAWAIPGTRLAFWVHFCTMFAAGALTLLWGYPYLVQGIGIAPATASVVLSVLIVGQVIGGPAFGAMIGRRPEWRMPIVLGYLGCTGATWLVLLGWPGGRPPLAIVVPGFLVFALGGPVSATAFALVRDYNPLRQVGTATGVANTGGHCATALAVLAVGVLLSTVRGLPAAEGYRIAMLALVGILTVGTCRVVVWWRRARAEVFAAQARGDDVPVILRQHRWDLPTSAETSAA